MYPGGELQVAVVAPPLFLRQRDNVGVAVAASSSVAAGVERVVHEREYKGCLFALWLCKESEWCLHSD